MYKGIFWCSILWFDDDMYSHNLLPVRVKCDTNGKALEECTYSSKSGDSFNHITEWEKMREKEKACRKHPFNYYPRGRVDVKNGNIKIFANPVIIDDDEAKKLIIDTFELTEYKESIKWIADNSKHYHYLIDAMSCWSDK